jgi:HNH endonuclease/Helix-turn-helix domain
VQAAERFLAKCVPEPNSGCWLWIGATNNAGYGHLTVGNRTVKAHRRAYELFRGPIPVKLEGEDVRGVCIIHSCDTPLCVNPDHLRIGTHKHNMQDKRERNRFVCNPLLGENHQNSKLTARKVRLARRLHVDGCSYVEIARRFGVHRATIRDAIVGMTWSHVT